MAFVLIQTFHCLKITASQLLEIIDHCHLFVFSLLLLPILSLLFNIYLYLLRNNFII
mgnify:CR=1 FL=1